MIVDVEDIDPEVLWCQIETYSNDYKSVTMNLVEYSKILALSYQYKRREKKFETVTSRKTLQKGIYAYVDEMEIRCNKTVPPGKIVFE